MYRLLDMEDATTYKGVLKNVIVIAFHSKIY